MAIFSVYRPCQEPEPKYGCGELVPRESSQLRYQSQIHFSTCDNSDLRNLAVGDTFEICQADYPDRKLYFEW